MKRLHDIEKEMLPVESYKMLIGGQWVDSVSKATTKSYNPATGELLAEYASGNAEDVDLAVSAAKKAFHAWSQTSAIERQSALLKIADLLEAEQKRFAILESLDTGKPLNESLYMDLP
ncbi:aldehyde dehydrogenase family protein, partial [Enterobacter hormaechei]|nr:aldehyde dehydrogenase family protein [Enterobacter hormaechei]